jgi:hypothetical protein
MANSVMLTAIPNGIVSADASSGTTVASLSVYVTPQIADTSLAATSPLANWPAVAAGLTFRVQFRGTSTVDPFAIATLDPNPQYTNNRFDQALWQAIFAPGAFLRPWSVQDYAASGVLSFKAKDVSAAVRATYGAAAPLKSRPVVTAGGTDVISRRTQDIASVLAHGPEVGQQVKTAIGAVARLLLIGLLPWTAYPPNPRARAVPTATDLAVSGC